MKNFIKIFVKRIYSFWFETKINEDRLREIKMENLKSNYPTFRM